MAGGADNPDNWKALGAADDPAAGIRAAPERDLSVHDEHQNARSTMPPAEGDLPPFANLGCGTVILPCEQPEHHHMLPAELYSYPNWHNIDRIMGFGTDTHVDLFSYPWRVHGAEYDQAHIPDNFYGGALLSHLVEHIPHPIDTSGFCLRPGRVVCVF